jgi:RNA polymerase sigma-70 factor (ECF subfamily)
VERESSDRFLVKRLLAGDERAFEEFFGGYFPRLYRFALSRVENDPDAAEEVVQETLHRAVSKLRTFRGEARLFTWLCTFCRHEISAYWRRQNRQPHRVDLIEEVPEIRASLESLLTSVPDRPDERALRKEIARLVQVTLDQLPPRYGDALEWKYIHGLSVKEIAELLHVGPKAAESLLSRARQAFRDGFSTLSERLVAASPGSTP